ncbi:MAG: pspA [Rhodospirillales bacterium]|nr:pspA [Rhodospirillales bacterium]
MGIFSRLSDIVNSNINSLLDKAEDPEKIIRLIIQEMEDTLVEVRSDAVRIIADRKEAERQIARLTVERDDWEAKAELAISKGREDLARAALVAKTRVAEAVDNETKHLNDINTGLEQQGEDIARLQVKLDDARKREALMISRHKTATSRLQARRVTYDNRIVGALGRMEAMERSLDHLEGKVEVFDHGRAPNLADEIAALQTDHAVDEELARIKEKLSTKAAG